jgi:hypothetical protein
VIPWWGWLALWTSLGIVFLLVLALAGWLLFRKFVRVMEDFGDLAEKSMILDNLNPDPPSRAPISILEPYAEVWQRRSHRRYLAYERKTERRHARLARARRIIAVDASTIDVITPRRR